MRYLTIILLALTSLNFTLQAKTDDIFAKPQKEQLVIDNAGVFTPDELQRMKEKLHEFSNQTSTQVLIYTTPDLQGYDVADFAQRLGESWGIGNKKFDNGIVIVFKPKNQSPGQVAIQTGYGIEALIPDATANQIVNHEMIPSFKNGNIYEGIDKALDVCIALTKGEYTANNYSKNSKSNEGSSIGGFIILMVIIITFFRMFGKSKNNQHFSGKKSSLPFWLALGLMSGGSRNSSGWGSFSGGSVSFGGGSSFGGFAGGSFGGGGASGSW
jgi:uncharacterized protein